LLAVAGLVVCGLAGVGRAQAPADGRAVTALPEWNGVSRQRKDINLWKAAPPSGFIADPAAWAKLWKAWHGGAEPPAVDFTKELVLVATGPGPNFIHAGKPTLNDRGDLHFTWGITERAGPGFTFLLLKVSRAGVRSVNGKAVPRQRAAAEPRDYLTADGGLRERIEVRELQGGVAGFIGTYVAIEPDGSWAAGPFFSTKLPKATARGGKLTARQLAALAQELARHDLAGLRTHGKPGVNPHVFEIHFGKKVVRLYGRAGTAPAPQDRAVYDRFVGIVHAVQIAVRAE
jgi:hypothetical protein